MAGERTVLSYAKVNLGLRILGKRPDGYHDIETIFKLIGLHDRIMMRRNASGRLSLTSSNPDLATDETNIITKAVRILEQRIGQPLGMDIHVTKTIPMGAGLGGGSSNGAAVLAGLTRWMQLDIPDDQLMDLGAQLGSDVPFFVGCYLGKGTTARGRGRGEILDYFECNLGGRLVLIYPRIHVSTAWAYANFSKYLRGENGAKKSSFSLTNKVESIMFSPLLDKSLFFGNDFEPLVLANHDEIRVARDSLMANQPVLCQMSGSGSSVFALFENDESVMPGSFTGMDVFRTHFVNDEEMRRQLE